MSKHKTVTRSSCHHAGDEIVLKINGVSVFGASVYKLVPVSGDVLLNCTNSERDEPEDQAFPEGYESLQEHVSQFTVINLNWPDGDAPDVAPAFWRDLPKLVKRNGGVSLVPYCLGSHGRTGTALASMAIIHKRLTAFQAVDLIREKHCHKAVETAAQCDYLNRVEVWATEQGVAIQADGKCPEGSYTLFPAAPVKKQHEKQGAILDAIDASVEDDYPDLFRNNHFARPLEG